MRIGIHSDLHYEFNKESAFSDAFLASPPDVLLLLGDCTVFPLMLPFFISLRTRFNGEILYVLGNHEYYAAPKHMGFDDITEAYKHNASLFDIKVLSNDSAVLNGVVFAGTTLWSGLENNTGLYVSDAHISRSLADFSQVPEMTPNFMREQYKKATDFLCKTAGDNSESDVFFLTHFSPSLENRNTHFPWNSLTDYFATGAGKIAELYPNVRYWAYGHTHGTDVYPLSGNCTTLTNQRGYPNERSVYTYEPDYTIEINKEEEK